MPDTPKIPAHEPEPPADPDPVAELTRKAERDPRIMAALLAAAKKGRDRAERGEGEK
jgi:hypothetical protein